MTPNADNVEQQKLSFIADENVKWCRHFGRQFGSFLQNQTVLPYNPAIVLPDIYSIELKHFCIKTVLCRCLQHNCQHLAKTKMYFSKWMDKLAYSQTMEYHSVIK